MQIIFLYEVMNRANHFDKFVATRAITIIYMSHLDWLAIWVSAHNLRHHGNNFSEALRRESDTTENLLQACFDLDDGYKIMLMY